MSLDSHTNEPETEQALDLFERRYAGDNADSDSCSHSGSCDDDYSSCSSYTDSDSDYGCVEWESEVKESGQLNFIISHPHKQNPVIAESQNVVCHASDHDRGLLDSTKSKKVGGKFVRLIRRRESKRHRSKITGTKETSVIRSESNVSAFTSHNPSPHLSNESDKFYEVELKVDPWVLPNLGRRATCSETLLGVVINTPESGSDVFVIDFVPDGLAARQCSIKLGDKIVSVNGMMVNTQNFNTVLEKIKTPLTLQLIMSSVSRHSNISEQDMYCQSKPKTMHQTLLAEYLSGQKAFANELQEVLDEIPMAVLYLQLDGLTEGGSEDQGVVYCYPGNIQSNTLCAVRGAFMTLQQLIPDVTHSVPVSSSLIIREQLTHVAYVEENRELLLLALPQSRCSLPETVKICSELVKVIQFKHQSLSRCFSSSVLRPEVDHFMSIFLARVLKSEKWFEISQKHDNSSAVCYNDAVPQFESLLPAAHWMPLPREVQVQIDDALNELESNDLGDMCDDHDCQRLYTILGCCMYHKGYLLASHLVVSDLLDVHAFCRQQGLLHLNQTEPVRSLIIWHEVYPSSVLRGQQSQSSMEHKESIVYGIPEGRWFILIVGQKYDMLVMLLEAGGCSSRAEGSTPPDAIYVEAAQDTLRHLQKTGIASVASTWLESNLRPEVTCPESMVASKASPRRMNNLLGLRLPHDGASVSMGRHAGILSNLSSPSMRKSSDSLLNAKRRPSPDHSSSGPLHGETSEDSASLVASLPSDDTGPLSVKGQQRELHSAHSDNSEDSDSDWESFNNHSSHRLTSTTDLSNSHRSLAKKIEETIPSKITRGVENSVFHYVHVDVSEGVLLCPMLSPTSQICSFKDILAKFRSCAMRIHTLLQNSISFKKLKGTGGSQSHINKSLVAIKEFGALFEYHFPSRANEKTPRSLTYWVVGRLFFTPLPREVYVCYHDSAPQNMVELAFRLSLTSVG